MQGKIIKGIAGFYYVHVVGSGVYECKAKGIFRKEKIKPLVGDNVEIEILDESEKEGNITRILPRSNELIRPAVANIDQVLVVFAVAKPTPHLQLLDRFLVMMESKHIPAVLCFNKQDLAGDSQIESLREIYASCGCPCIFTSVREEKNIGPLIRLLHGKTTAAAGPSGVGKSSLINLLVPEAEMETGAISEKIERGKHTTRHSELFPIESRPCGAEPCEKETGDGGSCWNGSYIMDTPGFSSLYVTDFEKEDLKYYFPDFAPYEGSCRFQGCSHIHEPGCRVKQAVEEGRIPQVRYQDYVGLYEELRKKRRY